MKKIHLFFSVILIFLFVSSLSADAATVMTDEQITEMAAVATAGGDVGQFAEGLLTEVTADLVAQGLSGDELATQIKIAIQELVSGVNPEMAGFQGVVNEIFSGAASGIVAGVNRAVGADPNLDADALTSSVVQAAGSAVDSIVANNPELNRDELIVVVNQSFVEQGVSPAEPEAFEPSEPDSNQQGFLPPQPEIEEPPTQDDGAGSPI